MLIFERSLTWKTFIEYDDPESAVKARAVMNDKLFCDDPTLLMNVYASKLTYITFQENNTGGVGIYHIYIRLHSIEIEIEGKIAPLITCNKTCSSTASLLKLLIFIVLNAIPAINVLTNSTNKCSDGIIIVDMCRRFSNSITLV